MKLELDWDRVLDLVSTFLGEVVGCLAREVLELTEGLDGILADFLKKEDANNCEDLILLKRLVFLRVEEWENEIIDLVFDEI